MEQQRLSKKQKIMYDFIAGFIEQYGYSPTFREIGRGLNLKSIATVAQHIDNLITLGWLIKTERVGRSLELAVGQKTELTTLSDLKVHLSKHWARLNDAQKNTTREVFRELKLEKLLPDESEQLSN